MYEILYKFIDLVFIPINFLFELKIPLDGLDGGIREITGVGDIICIVVILACYIHFIFEITIIYKDRSDV